MVLGCCAREPIPETLALSAVETRSVAAEGPFEVSGEALPSDRSVKLELRGVMHSPGRSDRSVRAQLAGRVLSPERLVALFDASVASEFGRGTFDGRLEVLGERSSGARWRGTLTGVSFDIDGPTVRSAERLRGDAHALLQSLSIDISDDASLARGLVVARAQAAGLGACAGVRAGDVIESANGVRIHALSDLAPPPGGSMRLQVRRAGVAPFTLAVPLPAATPFVDRHLLGLYCLACPVLLLLFWLLPLPTPGNVLTRCLARLRELRVRGVSPSDKLGVALSCALGGASGFIVDDVVDVFAVLLVHAALVMLLYRRGASAQPARLAHAAVSWLGVGCAAALSGTRSWLGIVSDQGVLPWEWNVFARLPLGLACVLCVWHAARLHAPAEAAESQVRRAVDSAGRSVLAALFGALFLGGARHGLGSSRELIAIGSALAAGKSLLMFGLLIFAGARSRLQWRVQVALVLTLPLSVALWLWLAPSRAFELTLGGGTCALLGLALIVALAERRATRRAAVFDAELAEAN
jgi:hypothetical protein